MNFFSIIHRTVSLETATDLASSLALSRLFDVNRFFTFRTIRDLPNGNFKSIPRGGLYTSC